MLISCEKCSTTYVLDDKLIPAAGAPVQCTRCGHVFTAKAPAAAPAATSTMMFGAPGAAGVVPPAEAAASPRATMMFGAAGANAAGQVPPPAHTPPSRGSNSTMMFGAAATTTPQATSGGQPTNRTMMFGAAGANAASAPAPQAPSGGSPNKTMMFGVNDGPPPAAAPASRTMVFGAAAAGVPAAAPAQPNRTMMFGAVGSGDAGPVPAPVPSGGQPNRTMMFGAVGAQNAAPAGSHPPQAPPARASGTMIFGAAAGPSASAAQTAAPRSTMMFGAPAANAPDASSDGPTPNQGGRTAMFGMPSPVADQPPQGKSNTMMFGVNQAGAPAAAPRAAPKLTESTVRIGPEDLERMMREHEALGRAPSAEAQSAVDARHNQTQQFAFSDAQQQTPPVSHADVDVRHGKTAMFAMSDINDPNAAGHTIRGVEPVPEASTLTTFPADAQVAAPGRGSSTMIFGGVEAAPYAPTLVGSTAPNLTALPGDRVELPPDDAAITSEDSGRSTQPAQDADVDQGDPAQALAAQVGRRNRIAGAVIALALVVVALAVGWKVFGRMLLSRNVPIEAMQGTESALATLRFDDDESKEKAVLQLTGLVAQFPDFIEAHAALVTALALQLDDVQQHVRRLEKDVEGLNGQISKLNKDRPSEWEQKATSLSNQATKFSNTHKVLAETGRALDTRVREAYRGLEDAVNRIGDPSTQARLATIRAQALFHGVSGTDQALVLTKRYEATEAGATDGWIDLAIPEYAANARVSDELVAEAMSRLDELHKRDSTFLRTYMLSARIHLNRREYDAADDDLDKVVSMRPGHTGATELRDWAAKHRPEKKPEAAAP